MKRWLFGKEGINQLIKEIWSEADLSSKAKMLACKVYKNEHIDRNIDLGVDYLPLVEEFYKEDVDRLYDAQTARRLGFDDPEFIPKIRNAYVLSTHKFDRKFPNRAVSHSQENKIYGQSQAIVGKTALIMREILNVDGGIVEPYAVMRASYINAFPNSIHQNFLKQIIENFIEVVFAKPKYYEGLNITRQGYRVYHTHLLIEKPLKDEEDIYSEIVRPKLIELGYEVREPKNI